MLIQDYRPHHDASGGGVHFNQRGDEASAAREHERSAERYEMHAALLDRYGAHRSANTERRHAEDERREAEAARARGALGSGPRERVLDR